jgi:PAS domain S-box-containing protein
LVSLSVLALPDLGNALMREENYFLMKEYEQMDKSVHSASQTVRPTIGYLAHSVSDDLGQAWWTGVVDTIQQHGGNSICFRGGPIHDPIGLHKQVTVLYDLLSVEILDGWVVGNIVADTPASFDKFKNLCGQRPGLPKVSLRELLKEILYVSVDNYQGMREAIIHLIEVHGYRRIAFLRGPEAHPYAQERYRAYTDVLQACGLPFDPNIVTPPAEWDASMIQVLLDERKLCPGTDFEAVVAVNDLMALDALHKLQAQGVRIPGDVAIVGFNNFAEGGVVTPALTSVALPFYEQGQRAAEILLALLAGKPVPAQTALPAKLVVRQSCGCQSVWVTQAAAGVTVKEDENFETALATRREQILAEMAQAMGATQSLHKWAGHLLDSFITALKNETPVTFLQELNELLRQVTVDKSDLFMWQGAVSALRRLTLPYLKGETLMRAEDLWQQTRVMVSQVTQQIQEAWALQAKQQAQIVHKIEQALVSDFDIEQLMNVIARELPHLGIPSCHLSLYEDPQSPAEWSRLILAYNDKGRLELEPGGQRFRSCTLVPAGMLPQDRPCSFVVESLHFQENHLGFVLFEVGPRDGAIYETLQGQISSALQGALLVQRVQDHAAQLARQQYILDTFLANVPDSIYFKDLESRITRANQAHATYLGLDDPTQEIGKTDFDFFPEEQARRKFEQEQEIIRTGQPILNVEEPEGPESWILTTKMPLRDEHGEIIGTFGISRDITAIKQVQAALEKAYAEVEQQVQERTAELRREIAEREQAQAESARLQQEVIEAQRRAIQELSTPIIPALEGIIIMPLIGSIDSLRARDLTRALLAGISRHKARVVILDVTGVPLVDSGVANHLHKTIQAARLKGARTIVTGISEAVAETIVDLGIDWSHIETMTDLQTGLRAVLTGQKRRE